MKNPARFDRVPPWGLDTASFRKLVVGALLALVLFLLPTPEGLTIAGKQTLALFVVIIYFWATEALPLPVTALGAGVGLVVIGTYHPHTPDWRVNDAWSPYAQDTIFFLLGSLILADAVTKTHADKVLASKFLRRAGTGTDKLLFGIIAVSAISAMFVSNHAVAAVMLPLVVSILRATGLIREPAYAAGFILAIALGAAIAGLGTPSGGSRNVIVLGYLDELYDIQISYLQWTVRAAPITLALIPVVYFVLKFAFRMPNRALDADALPLDESRMTPEQRRVLYIMGLTVVLWIWQGTRFGLGTIAIVGAILLFVTNILDWIDTRKRVAWGVPLIYGAALAMGQNLQDTGAVDWLSNTLLGLPIWTGPLVLVLGTLVLSVLLTNIMSDGGTAAVLAPVTMSLAFLQGYSVGDMGMITAIGAAFGYLLVVANPGNVITYQSGLFTPKDLAKAGLPLTVASIAITYLAVTFYWPLLP